MAAQLDTCGCVEQWTIYWAPPKGVDHRVHLRSLLPTIEVNGKQYLEDGRLGVVQEEDVTKGFCPSSYYDAANGHSYGPRLSIIWIARNKHGESKPKPLSWQTNSSFITTTCLYTKLFLFGSIVLNAISLPTFSPREELVNASRVTRHGRQKGLSATATLSLFPLAESLAQTSRQSQSVRP